jgi:hypothetical protein
MQPAPDKDRTWLAHLLAFGLARFVAKLTGIAPGKVKHNTLISAVT